MVKRVVLFALFACIPLIGSGAPPAPTPVAAPGGACSYLHAATIGSITGLHITSVKDNGDACTYADPTAPVSPVLQQFGQVLSEAFGGASPLRLKGAPNGVRAPRSGAGLIVRVPADVGDVSNVSVHDYVQSTLAQVPAEMTAEMGCGSPQDVSGLNATSIVCLGGGLGEGGVVKDGKVVMIIYLAPANATNQVVGQLLAAAAQNM